MPFRAGRRVYAADLTWIMDGFTLPSNFQSTAGNGTWTDWGGAAVIPNPGVPIRLRINGIGFAANTGTATWFGMRIAYSLDAGSTWTYGNAIYDWIGTGMERGSFACVARWAGTPTADIHIKAQVHPGVTTDATFREGDVDYLVIPGE